MRLPNWESRESAVRKSRGGTRMRVVVYFAGLVVSFALGAVFGLKRTSIDAVLEGDRHRAAYLVASQDILHPDQLKTFSAVVIPLARKAGLQTLAAAEPEVLEGNWPKGVLFVQRYNSMEALLKFWRSAENEAAQKLREGHVNSHFIVAVEAPQ
jgi:uncharacterized protein (DUF1330 family)